MNKIIYFIMGIIGFLGMASCSESDESSTEYENWQSRNDAYFEQYYDSAANGLNGWQTMKAISKNQDSTATLAHTDYILVKVLKNGTGTECPYANDTVRVHYRGWLRPSASYPDGYQFDSSWYGDYDVTTMTPYKANLSGFVSGFSTAVQHMHVGDRWLVVIPYQLGYDSQEKTGIPAYSVMRFDITLHSFSRVGHAMPSFQ